jgi:hypothetical protein
VEFPPQLLPCSRIDGHRVVIGHHAASIEAFGRFDQAVKRPMAFIV